jgi:hypothetical protein
MSTIERYLKQFENVPGFFVFDAMIAWEFFLELQTASGIAGHFLEIGVYQGKSAILGAMYMQPDELCFFDDINSLAACEAAVTSFRPDNNVFIQAPAFDLMQHPAVIHQRRRFRWVHIDGDHTGYSLMHDLLVAAELVAESGIICVDDFFSFRYPQLSAAAFRFLFDRSIEFKLLFCGSNKGYICKTRWYAYYESMIRGHFLEFSRRYSVTLQLNKTSYAHDFGCFSVSAKEGERDVIGLDIDQDKVVF